MNILSRHGTVYTQRGFSLLELSILIVLFGIGSVAFWQLSSLNRQQELPERQKTLLHRADQALTGFAFSQQRLPCPAQSPASGIEHCDGGQRATGYLPFRTLGLPDKEAGLIRYGVLRRSSSIGDADLTQRKARLQILHFNPGNETTSRARPSPQSDTQAYARESGVYAKDFCSALSTASSLPFNDAFVHIGSAKDPSKRQNVAYALALQKDARHAAEPSAASPSLTFGLPAGNRLSSQQDAVLAVSPRSLSTKLSCTPLVAAVRSYAYVHTAAAIHTRTLPDYLNQLDISVSKARATLVASTAGEVRAIADLLDSIAALMVASAGVTSATPVDAALKATEFAFAKWGTVSSIAAVTATSIGLPLAANNSYERARTNRDRVQNVLLPQANALKTAMDERMARVLNAGIQLPISVPTNK